MRSAHYKEDVTGKAEPKEFACADIGYSCPWKHVARTDDLLLDSTALHLRDVHGVQSLEPAMLNRIRSSFKRPSLSVGHETEIPQMKEFRCRDLDQKCEWRYLAQTEDLIVDGAAVHLRDAHGISEFTPEMITKVRKAIHVWEGEKAAA